MSWLMVSEALLNGVLALLSYANAEAENHRVCVLEYVVEERAYHVVSVKEGERAGTNI